jgi:lysozyme family protein
MARFEDAIGVILEHEGGLVDHKSDPGGVTNWGVSLRFALSTLKQDKDKDGWLDGDIDHDGDVDADDIRKMKREDAVKIYRLHFWKDIYGDIVSQSIATKLFDMAVNMGAGQAHKILQRAVNKCGDTIDVDGGFGPNTLSHLNVQINKRSERYFLSVLRQEAWEFYQNLIKQKPELAAFEKGWKNRAFS